jgi:hypothetical protein
MITTDSGSHEIINAVLETLFRNETSRHQKCIDHIASRNTNGNRNFVHATNTYMTSWMKNANIRMPRVELHESLWPEMEMLLLDMRAVENDSRVYWQLLFSMINPCTNLQDVRDTLPDFITDMMPGLCDKPRISPEIHTITDLRMQRQYAKHREKMEMYAMVSKNPSVATLIALYHYNEG